MQNVIHLEETKDHKLSESGTGRGYCFPPSDQLGGFRAESGESCQEPRESLVCSGRGSRRYPAPLAPPRLTRPGGSVCGPDARELRARVLRPRTYQLRVAASHRGGRGADRTRASSLPAGPPGAGVSSLARHGGRRLLPQSVRGGRPRAGKAPTPRPGAAGQELQARRPCSGPPRKPARLSLPRGLPRASGPQRAVWPPPRLVRKVQGTPADPGERLRLCSVCRCSAESGRCPETQEPREPACPGRPVKITLLCVGNSTAGPPDGHELPRGGLVGLSGLV